MRVLTWLRSRLDKWRLLLLAFALIYAALLLVNLSYMSMQWDEVTHFTGGLLLSRGQVGQWVWTNSFYPPAFDFVTTAYFVVAGASVLTGRLVAVTFSVFSLFVVYLIAEKMYDAKTAIMSAIFFGLMPGIVWLKRIAEHFTHCVWLNPNEPHYWIHPTVQMIGKLFPMFPLTLDGLEQAVRKLAVKK